MFLDCPAYLDHTGTIRCGLPAEVRRRFTMGSTDGPLESAMIRCPVGHWFNGPIESLTWQDRHQQDLGAGAATPSTRCHGRDGPDRSGSPGRAFTREPGPESSRPNSAPSYYLGRPARLWITALRRRGTRTTSDHLVNTVTSG